MRRYPGSRRNPQFNIGPLSASLAAAGISLHQFGETLGGRRQPLPDSPNRGWRVDGFRAYADHMRSPEFAAGLGELEALAERAKVAVMCAEADWHRCHRRLLADALLVRGWRVRHIDARGGAEDHQLTDFALVDGDRISYPPAQGTLAEPPE